MANYRIVKTSSKTSSLSKKILAIQYSQTGQLASVMDAFLAPLASAGASVHREILRHAPGHEYPHPWPLWTFMDTFPETVAGDPPPLAPLTIDPDSAGARHFDLIIIGYPVWFLSPPPALTAFLRGDAARKLLRGRPVVTVAACRNMWLMAQEKVKELLRDIGARHCDHVALTDRGSALATFITTPRWMLTGRKNAFWGLPPAGVPARDIAACSRFGRALLDALARDTAAAPPFLAGLRSCTVDARLIASERIGIRCFRIWSKILRACGRPGAPLRRVALFIHTVCLLMMIATAMPASMAANALLRPFLRARLARLRHDYEQPSGSGSERLGQFADNSREAHPQPGETPGV